MINHRLETSLNIADEPHHLHNKVLLRFVPTKLANKLLSFVNDKKTVSMKPSSISSTIMTSTTAVTASSPFAVPSPVESPSSQTSSTTTRQQYFFASQQTQYKKSSHDTPAFRGLESSSPSDTSSVDYLTMEDDVSSKDNPEAKGQTPCTSSSSSLHHNVHEEHFHPENDPWYYPDMSREEANTSLMKYTSIEGVFLVRTSSRTPGLPVLSFISRGKINHVSIEEVDADHGQVVLSLDCGQTKFYDLKQLIEFYQLNQGSLPTKLTHFLIHK